MVRSQGEALVWAKGFEDALGVALEDHAWVLKVEGFALHVQLGRIGAEAGQEVQGHVVTLHQRTGVYRSQGHEHGLAVLDELLFLPDAAVGGHQRQQQAQRNAPMGAGCALSGACRCSLG